MTIRTRSASLMPADTARLFFAVLPDAAARASLDWLAREVAAATGGRAPRAENMHLTLAFLGNVSRARLPDLASIGVAVAAGAPPFVMRLDQLGHFRGPGVAWVGPQATPPGLQRLFAALRDALERAGLPLEHRDFRPHVTLARRAVRAPPGVPSPIEWRVDALALMASESGPHGVRYNELAHWRLAETAALT